MNEPRPIVIHPAFKPPKTVHVTVLYPPNFAVTFLLNAMADRGGFFVTGGSMQQEVSGSLVNGRGQKQVAIISYAIFSVSQVEAEKLLGKAYHPAEMVDIARVCPEFANPG